MGSQGPAPQNHRLYPVEIEIMQVKRRINQFFGNILRKDKVQQQDKEESTSPSQVKNKHKNKNNQSYSQWDLMEHIAGEPIEDESSSSPRNLHEENMIYSDGLAYYTEEDSIGTIIQVEVGNEQSDKKGKSFLKRSGSLLRKSLRRSKKKLKNEEDDAGLKWQGMDQESLSNVVQEINSTLFAVATFNGKENVEEGFNGAQLQPFLENIDVPSENEPVMAHLVEDNEILDDITFSVEHQTGSEWNQEGRKAGLKNGLKRQASKLASKFQRTSGSMRLKSSPSNESFPYAERKRNASFSTNPIRGTASPDLTGDMEQQRMGSFKRKLSFKQAKKVVRKGVTSFGKSMIHASAVMPIAYVSPPVSFYPDYNDDEYPPHMVQCYYRTISYQPKNCEVLNDKIGQQPCHYARPTSFYQHGYCYNG